MSPSESKATGYLTVCLYQEGERSYRLVHRLVMDAFGGNCPEGKEVDHVDRNRKNNGFKNLRYVTKFENCHNITCKGYSFNKESGKWVARITVGHKPTYLGRFDTPEEARAAYVAAKQKLGVPNF